MSDPLRTDGSRAHDVDAGTDRDAKIEQLLLVGLDHYFASHYELAINVWTRALFLDRSHARARAYIERARSALAERQRESEELLQNGVAAFKRGESDEARRLLHAAIDHGAPSEEALAVLERLDRLEAALAPAISAPSERARRHHAPRTDEGASRSLGRIVKLSAFGLAVSGVAAFAVYADRVDWRALTELVALARNAGRASAPAPVAAPPVARESVLPPPTRGETMLARARALALSGHLHDAIRILESIRPTDPQQGDADRLRADLQRQLLALTPLPAAPPQEAEKPDRRLQ